MHSVGRDRRYDIRRAINPRYDQFAVRQCNDLRLWRYLQGSRKRGAVVRRTADVVDEVCACPIDVAKPKQIHVSGWIDSHIQKVVLHIEREVARNRHWT